MSDGCQSLSLDTSRSFVCFLTICSWQGRPLTLSFILDLITVTVHTHTHTHTHTESRLGFWTSLVFQLAAVICRPRFLGATMTPQPILCTDSSHWEQMDFLFSVQGKDSSLWKFQCLFSLCFFFFLLIPLLVQERKPKFSHHSLL